MTTDEDMDEVLAAMNTLIPQIEPMIQASAKVMARGVATFVRALREADSTMTRTEAIDLACAFLGGIRSMSK